LRHQLLNEYAIGYNAAKTAIDRSAGVSVAADPD